MVDKKVVLITGGSDGLGKTIAKKLTPKYQVVILAPDQTKTQKVAQEIGCDFVVADVSDYSSMQAVIDKTVKKYGHLDSLINSAGVWIQGTLLENDPNQIKKVLDVNTLGTINGTKAAISQMKTQGYGLIININSQAGLNPKEERSVYNASKWAITGFTRSIQPELAKLGIGITQIMPGGMNTDMFDKAGNPKDRTTFIDTQEVAKVIEFLLSLDRTTLIPELGIKHLKN